MSRHYVQLRCLEHFGEPAVLTGASREVDGQRELEVYVMVCAHGTERKIWIRRDNI